MEAINTRSAGAVAAPQKSASAVALPSASSDIPPPSALSGVLGAMAAMRTMQDERLEDAEVETKTNATERKAAGDRAMEKIREAAAEEQDAGFWGDVLGVVETVGAVAGIAAGVAGVAFTGGASLAVVGLIGGCLSAGGLAMKELDVDVDIGLDTFHLSDIVMFTGAGASLVSGVGAAIAGTAAQLSAGKSLVQTTLTGVQIANTGTGAVAGGMQSANLSDAQELKADAKEQRNQADAASDRIDELVGRIEDALKARQKALGSAAKIIETNGHAANAALGMRA